MSNQAILRITRELADIQKNSDLCTFEFHSYTKALLAHLIGFNTAIAVVCRDADVQNVKALIIGPPDTPYEFGFFEVGTKLELRR
ncbi:hypothetical protein MMC31_000622 [Peltigera leucophlebia]|nr:hypothetical protein [Peltigera leucophlebia]